MDKTGNNKTTMSTPEHGNCNDCCFDSSVSLPEIRDANERSLCGKAAGIKGQILVDMGDLVSIIVF